MIKYSAILLSLFFSLFLNATSLEEKTYLFSQEPIDVVIPCVKKDLKTLKLAINGIRKNGKDIRNIYIVSSKRLTHKAKWFNEKLFPFSKEDIAKALSRSSEKIPPRFLGWYYQQLLKFYAPYVIPNISSNVLVLDADTIFLLPVSFRDETLAPYFTVIDHPFKTNRLNHMKRFVPGLNRIEKKYSGVVHHMLFQKPILDDLFEIVESHHKEPLWQAFCHCVPKNDYMNATASEYEIYLNFALTTSNQVKTRFLKNRAISNLKRLKHYRRRHNVFVSAHSFMREQDDEWNYPIHKKYDP